MVRHPSSGLNMSETTSQTYARQPGRGRDAETPGEIRSRYGSIGRATLMDLV